MLETLKNKYDVVAKRDGNTIKVIHEGTNLGIKQSYSSEDEFNKDMNSKGVKSVIMESING